MTDTPDQETASALARLEEQAKARYAGALMDAKRLKRGIDRPIDELIADRMENATVSGVLCADLLAALQYIAALTERAESHRIRANGAEKDRDFIIGDRDLWREQAIALTERLGQLEAAGRAVVNATVQLGDGSWMIEGDGEVLISDLAVTLSPAVAQPPEAQRDG